MATRLYVQLNDVAAPAAQPVIEITSLTLIIATFYVEQAY